MIVQSTQLKSTLKKLASVKSESIQFGPQSVSARDSDVWVVLPNPIPEISGFNINGKKLTSVVNRMSGNIDVSQNEKSLVLKSAKARVELEIHPVSSFDTPPAMPDDAVSLDTKQFKQALTTGMSSAATSKSPEYGGVVQIQTLPLGLEETSPSGYRVVGTDSNLLTVAKVQTPVSKEFDFLLNLEAASAVQLMDSDSVTIGFTDKGVLLQSDDTLVVASRPNKSYPGFDPLLREEPKIQIGLKPEEWSQALRTVEPLVDDETDQGAVALHFDQSVVRFETIGTGSKASDEAGYEQLLPDPVFDAKKFVIYMKAKHLSAFLSKAGDDARLDLVSTIKPIKMISGDVVRLTMPLRGSK